MMEAKKSIVQQVEERVAQARAALGSGDDSGDGKPSSKLIHECLFANEYGDGVLFAYLFQDRYLFNKNAGEWFTWQGHFWKRDILGDALGAVEDLVACYLDEYKRISARIAELIKSDGEGEAIKKLKLQQKQLLKRASQLRGDNRRTACLKFAHTLQEGSLAVTGDEFDRDPWLYACANGVINLKTGEIKDGRPGDRISMASPVEWQGIDAPAPLWEKIINEVMNNNDDLAAYLQRLFGYCLTGLTTEQTFPVLWGKGRNGKSLIVETISYVMGPMAAPIQAEMLLSQRFSKGSAGPSPDIMGLRGLRLAFASETDEGNKFSASKVKWLTGSDNIKGRNPHDKYDTVFKPTHKLMLLTNSQPQAPASDFAFWERLHLIPFLLSFVNREPQDETERRAIVDLDTQLVEEYPGILAWLVRGCLLWQKYGLAPPRNITDATETYRQNEDLLAGYIDERLIQEPGAKEKSSVLYQDFCEWYEENVGKRVPSGTWFGKEMSRKFEKTKIKGSNYYHGCALAVREG